MIDAPTIRLLLPHEAPLLAALAERLFRETYDSPTHVDMLDPYCARAFAPGVQEGELAERGASALLVEVAGEPAGYAQLRRRVAPVPAVDPGAIEVARFYVDRRHHGTGIAHRLMDAVLAQAAAEGVREVWLQVAEYNDRALAFYRKRGFRAVGRIPFDFAGVRELDHLLAIEVLGVSGGAGEPVA